MRELTLSISRITDNDICKKLKIEIILILTEHLILLQISSVVKKKKTILLSNLRDLLYVFHLKQLTNCIFINRKCIMNIISIHTNKKDLYNIL